MDLCLNLFFPKDILIPGVSVLLDLREKERERGMEKMVMAGYVKCNIFGIVK